MNTAWKLYSKYNATSNTPKIALKIGKRLILLCNCFILSKTIAIAKNVAKIFGLKALILTPKQLRITFMINITIAAIPNLFMYLFLLDVCIKPSTKVKQKIGKANLPKNLK